MDDLEALAAHLRGRGRILLGYSGGVDSAVLAVVATRALAPGQFLAVLGQSASLAADQRQQAETLAARFGVPLRVIETEELANPQYAANPTNRCYFCKSELWRQLGALADAEAFDTIIDGTNADDVGEHRPGMRAGREHTVASPLADLGWTKARVREAARALGLPIWDAPASPCLASRIQYGVAVTAERLAQVEAGEALLRRLGVTGNLRVRHLDQRARVEVEPSQFPLVKREWEAIETAFHALGFDAVQLDPAGYRRGALLQLT